MYPRLLIIWLGELAGSTVYAKINPVIAFILTLNESYDQTLQWHSSQKMIGQVAATSTVKVTDDEIRARRAARELNDDVDADEELDAAIRTDIHRYKCDALLQQFVGAFRLLERIGRLAYKLNLPETMRIYSIISVTHLEPATDPAKDSYNRSRDLSRLR